MRSLGLGGSNHGFSARLVDGGDMVVGIEEERIARVKYSVGVNSLLNKSWRYCLDVRTRNTPPRPGVEPPGAVGDLLVGNLRL
jgi:predicted NodU family carbamoyl transferase